MLSVSLPLLSSPRLSWLLILLILAAGDRCENSAAPPAAPCNTRAGPVLCVPVLGGRLSLILSIPDRCEKSAAPPAAPCNMQGGPVLRVPVLGGGLSCHDGVGAFPIGMSGLLFFLLLLARLCRSPSDPSDQTPVDVSDVSDTLSTMRVGCPGGCGRT